MEINSYGTFLTSIIFYRITNELRIIISRKFKSDVCGLRKVIDIFKQGLFARERFYAIGKDADNDVTFLNEHSLLTQSQEKKKSFKPNSRPGYCVYCDDKKHICSGCNVITYVETRRNLLKNQGRCFVCLSKGHVSNACKANYSCVKCKNRSHVNICLVENDKKKTNAGIITTSQMLALHRR